MYIPRMLSVKKTFAEKLADGFQFVDNFLLLYASVLEPYRDLSLGQVSLGRYSPPFVFGDKFVGSVLAFEFLQLHLGVWNALFPSASVRAGISSGVRSRIWEENTQARPHELLWTRCAQTLHLHLKLYVLLLVSRLSTPF